MPLTRLITSIMVYELQVFLTTTEIYKS